MKKGKTVLNGYAQYAGRTQVKKSGTEHIGKKLQESICCAKCSAARKALKGDDPDWELHANGDQADPSRCFCIHRRECIVKYARYETIPCKGCRRFKEKEDEWY